MNEANVRAKIISILKPWDAVAVENAAGSGTPDVNYIEGWLELKWLPEWPKRETTCVRVDKFTPQQRLWIERRARAGGKVSLILRVSKEWLLMDGLWAALHLGQKTRQELILAASGYWKNQLDSDQFLEILKPGGVAGERKPSLLVNVVG